MRCGLNLFIRCDSTQIRENPCTTCNLNVCIDHSAICSVCGNVTCNPHARGSGTMNFCSIECVEKIRSQLKHNDLCAYGQNRLSACSDTICDTVCCNCNKRVCQTHSKGFCNICGSIRCDTCPYVRTCSLQKK